MCEGSFLPSSFGPHQKHTEFESSLRSYLINLCALFLAKVGSRGLMQCRASFSFLRVGAGPAFHIQPSPRLACPCLPVLERQGGVFVPDATSPRFPFSTLRYH